MINITTTTTQLTMKLFTTNQVINKLNREKRDKYFIEIDILASKKKGD